MMKTTKIGFILYSLSGGGTEKRLLYIVNHLLNKNIRCELILFQKNNDYPRISEHKYRLKIHYLTGSSKLPSGLLKAPYIVYALFRLVGIIRRQGITILFSSEPLMDMLAATASVFFSVKQIINICIPADHLNSSYSRLLRFAYERSTRIICISHGLARHTARYFRIPGNKITVIPNGLLLPHTIPANQTEKKALENLKRLKKKNVIILALGRLENQKNPCGLITGFNIVHKRYPSTKLIFVGQGSLKTRMEKLIRTLHLSEHVFIFGFTETPGPFLKSADIFVLNSLYEGFGNVILEAMASGVPAISTSCPYGPQEIVDPASAGKPVTVAFGKYGILVKPDHPVYLAQAIISLTQDKRLRGHYRIMGKQRVQAFSQKEMLEAYFSEVISVIKRK